jgi:hypothetical protein
LPVVERSSLPRALLPLQMRNGMADLSGAKDASQSGQVAPSASGQDTITLWIDLHIPADAVAGQYTATCDLFDSNAAKPSASLPISLTIHDFLLPDERHLAIVGRLDWAALRRLYPEFENVEPRLISRRDDRYAPAVQILDRLMELAEQNRAQFVIPRLQPTVKWPPGAAAQVDWTEFDSVVGRWLSGEDFEDKIPLGYWPLPAIDFLSNYAPIAQAQYWTEAARHFEQFAWLSRAVANLEKTSSGRPNSSDSIALSAEAARILAVHPKLRVSVPLEAAQLQLASAESPGMIDPQSAGRLIVAAPGLVSNSPLKLWPADIPEPSNWLRTDLPGLVPYTGAGGDERDLRLWAWLAFLRDARLIQWASPLPTSESPLQSADPGDVVWFYPGSWFGVDQPVPTVQLKWMRRAEQDYEYLWLARQRGQNLNALVMARLITRPVEIQPNQPEDPTYALMCGATDPRAWDQACELLARNILLHGGAEPPDPAKEMELNVATLHWATPLERPVLMGRSTQWLADGGAGMLGVLGLRLGVDLYNASDAPPAQNQLRWTSVPSAWQDRHKPSAVPTLATYRVQRFVLDTQIDPARINNTERVPVELTFINGYDKHATSTKMMLPMAISDRHPPGLKLDGSLADWSADDAIQDGPLVQLFNRPAVQAGALQLASTS